MKKLFSAFLCLTLAAAMVLSAAALEIPTYKDQDGDETCYNEGYFYLDSPSGDLLPGADYYLPAYYQDGTDLDDEFFSNFTLSQSFVSDTEGVSNSSFRNHFSTAEFEKGTDGRWYFHIAISTKKDASSLDGGIIFFGKDKMYPNDTRIATSVEFTIDYNARENFVDEEEYTLTDPNGAVVEFEDTLKRCVITFENDSTLRLTLDTSNKYNLCYDTTVSAAIKKANPGARLQQMTFYGRPTFASNCTFKYFSGSGAKYFYELSDDNTLTLLSDSCKDGYFGISTSRLGNYIASDVLLTGAAAAPAAPAQTTVPESPAPAHQNPNTGAAL